MICVIGGGLLIKALLIDAFMSTYTADQAVVTKQPQLKRKRSLAATLEIWARHSIYSQAMYGIERNKQQTTAYSEFTKTGLPFDTVVDLLLMGDSLGWVVSLKGMAAQVAKLQLEIGQSSQQGCEALLNVCAELSLQDVYESIRSDSIKSGHHTESFDARREAVAVSRKMLETSTQCSYEEALWLRGRSPKNRDLQRAIYKLPELLGLEMPPSELAGCDNQDAIIMYEALLRFVRLFYLQKWALHRIFVHVNKMEEGNPRAHFQQMFRMCNAMDHMAEAAPARVDSVRLAAEDLLTHLDNASDANSIGAVASDAKFVNDASKLMQITKLMSREVVSKQEQLDASTAFDLYSEANTAVSQHARQLPFHALRSALCEGMFKWNNNEDSRDQMIEDLIIRFEITVFAFAFEFVFSSFVFSFVCICPRTDQPASTSSTVSDNT